MIYTCSTTAIHRFILQISETEERRAAGKQSRAVQGSRAEQGRTYLRLRASALGAGAPPEGDDRRGGYWAAGSWPAGRPFEASMRGGGRAGRRPGRSGGGRGRNGLAGGEERRRRRKLLPGGEERRLAAE